MSSTLLLYTNEIMLALCEMTTVPFTEKSFLDYTILKNDGLNRLHNNVTIYIMLIYIYSPSVLVKVAIQSKTNFSLEPFYVSTIVPYL